MMRRRLLLGAVAALCMTSCCAFAESVADFYKTNSIRIIVGNGPGGGFDAFGRLVAEFIPKYIPGHPSVTVINMPGAGSLVAANYIYNVAPKDGTVFGVIARNVPLLAILGGNSNVHFDPLKFTWLGSPSDFSNDAYLLIARKDSPIKSAEDLMRPGGPPLILGGTASGGTSADVPKILHDALGMNFKMIDGYRDSPAIYLALDRGEVSGGMNEMSSLKTARPQWLAPDSNFRVLLQYARGTRHPDLPNVPTARELAKTDEARSLIDFTEKPFALGWPFTAPPGIPEDRAEALEKAFVAVHHDPEFLAQAAKAHLEMSPVDGAAIRKDIEEMEHAPKPTLDYVRNLISATTTAKKQ